MPSQALITQPKPTTYKSLLRSVRKTLAAGRERAKEAVEQEKVRTVWEVGNLILEHILFNEKRGQYGQSVLKRLAKDLNCSLTELRYMVEFARTYPNLPPAGDLPWAHYRDLLGVNDAAKRQALLDEASGKQWTREKLRKEIRKYKGTKKTPSLPIFDILSAEIEVQKPGKAGVYRIENWYGNVFYDLGFKIYVPLKRKRKQTKEPCEEDLYWYKARVLEVYDGDTFHALIDVGRGIKHKQRLRLWHLNAPELVSAHGLHAKKALEKVLLGDRGHILINTSKTGDKYGRYLADVWVRDKRIDEPLLASGLFHSVGKSG